MAQFLGWTGLNAQPIWLAFVTADMKKAPTGVQTQFWGIFCKLKVLNFCNYVLFVTDDHIAYY